MDLKPHDRTGTEEEAKAAWERYVQENGLPDNIPENPDEVYTEEWKGWVDWLGWTHPKAN